MISIFNGQRRTLGDREPAVFVKVDVGLREYLHLFRGAKLGVFLAICLHADENGWAWPSYGTLMRETGYGSQNTIARALAELCELTIEGQRVLLRHQPVAENGTFESNRYLIFPTQAEIAQYEYVQLPCPENQDAAGRCTPPENQDAAQPCPKKCDTVEPSRTNCDAAGPSRTLPYTVEPYTAEPYTVNCETNQNHDKQEPCKPEPEKQEPPPSNTNGGDGSKAELAQGLQSLGMTDAAAVVEKYDPDQIAGWLNYASTAEGLTNPAGLVKARLKAGVPPPPPDRDNGDSRKKYITGEYADLIQH